ncbi:poly-gamma-glutamate hydrolase family protein [Massilia sp. BJB1822]|uniref:poly-gamma-glutamate hydrolase family protein n=1 Tax=Massilia sp. BJB1822 TaxID=2744470 RepID=UPI001594E4F7|nr:poly-gamma-glutamate hydrolase family protein [Massilia sp. BJB1822]NVD97952.1 poly-gamma-glutamate hydrolase family protein [Massilia sp. BJB1822]
MADIYNSFSELAAIEAERRDFRIVIRKGRSSVAIIAPHAGRIERHTSVIARHIAGADHSLYLFEGCKANQNGSLHITSERFDEPQCLELVERSRIAVGVHGAAGEDDFVIVGGRNARARTLVLDALRHFGATEDGKPHLLGLSPGNICNRASNGGVQLEISSGLRDKLVGVNPHFC